MMGVLEGIKEEEAYAGGPDGPLFVSIAAGLSTARLKRRSRQGRAWCAPCRTPRFSWERASPP